MEIIIALFHLLLKVFIYLLCIYPFEGPMLVPWQTLQGDQPDDDSLIANTKDAYQPA